MKFSNGVPVNSVRSTRQDAVSVAWQSVVLDAAETAVGSSPAQLDGLPAEANAQTALTVKDDLIGVPVATDESQYNAHAITLHSQSVGAPIMGGSSLVLASDSMNEVVSIYLQQAEAYCEEDQWEKAFEACQEILKVAPATAEAYKFLGKILQKQGRPIDAMGFYAKAIMIQPNFPEVYVNLGSLYAQRGKWEEAVSYYQKAIERDPELALAYWNLAKIWKRLGRQDSELNCRATALQLQPDLGSAKEHFALAQAMEAANNTEGAIRFYQQAVEQDPKLVAAYQRLADLLEASGDWQAAAECYRKVLMLNAEAEKARAAQLPTGSAPIKLSPEGQQQMQQLLQASSTKQIIGQVSAGDSVASRLSLSPAEAASLSPTELAKRYAAAKDWPRAIECMQAAITKSPSSAILYRSLAKLFEENNSPKLAAEAWYRSFVLEPDWPDAQQCFTLGRVLARYGNTEAAMLCYRQSIQLQPDFTLARKALDQLVPSSSESISPSPETTASADTVFQQAVAAKK